MHLHDNSYSNRRKRAILDRGNKSSPRSSRLIISASRRVDESEADHESCSEDEELPNGLASKTSPGGSRMTVNDSLRRRSGRLRKKNDEESEEESSSSASSSSGDDTNCKCNIFHLWNLFPMKVFSDQGGRPNRKRRPVQRLTYEAPERAHKSCRVTKREINRNSDQVLV